MTIFNEIVNGYPAVVEPQSNKLLRIGATLFTLARISTFYKVKIRDNRTIDTFSNIYFLFFGGSGEGKGKVMQSFDHLDCFKDFLVTERDEIKQFEKQSLKKYADEYFEKFAIDKVFESAEAQVGFEAGSKDDKNEKRKAITYARSRVKNVQPIMTESTRPNLETTAIAIDECDKISVSIKHEEFLVWIKRKKSESFEMFEFMAEVYDTGKAVTKGTNIANKSVDEASISNFPLNAVFLSSEYLMSDAAVNGVLKDFFITAGARRFLTGVGGELEEPLYTQDQLDEIFDGVKNETDVYLSRFIASCERFSAKGIIIKPALRRFIAQDKEQIKQAVKESRVSELSKIEIRGSIWKSVKIAGLLAFLNHPDSNIMTQEDYEEARAICRLFIKSFQKIVEKNWMDKSEVFKQYIRENPGCSKGDIYKLNIFSKEYHSRTNQYKNYIDICTEELLTEDEELIIKQEKKSVFHYIKQVPQDIVEQDQEFLYQFSVSKDLAKGYTAKQFTLQQMLKCMNNDKKINYSPGSYSDEYRTQKNWQGEANCLVLDIDNEQEELTIEEAKKIFKDYSFIIQPTKSHQKDKGSHGIKDRYRMVFPTLTIPKMVTKRYKNIYENFHKDFGITKYGDIKASGDTARFYYPSPHKAEFCKGIHRVNWEMYDIEEEEPKLVPTVRSTNRKTAKNTDPGLASFFSQHQDVKGDERRRVKCPMHADKTSSAFVARHKESGNLYLSCSVGSCSASDTIFEK